MTHHSSRTSKRVLARWAAIVGTVVCGAAAVAVESRAGEEPAASPGSQAQLVMLGTGTPLAEAKRSGPSVAVVVADTAYFVDFGPGVVRQASAAWEGGIEALHPASLGIAFSTHLHSDHTTGLADLALAPWVLGRVKPLELYGPPGIAAMAKHITSAYAADIERRVSPPEFLPRAGSDINAHEIKPGVVFENEQVRVEAFPVKHGLWKYAYGYRFDAGGRSIVISGDTRPSEVLVEKAKGCDVLVHEAYLKSTFDLLPKDTRDYHSSHHTSALQLGKLAKRIQPKLLVVYHTLLFGGAESSLLREIQRNFEGRVVIAKDLDIF